jgi:beta-galactosidase
MKLAFSILFSFYVFFTFAQENGETHLPLNGEWKFKIDPYTKGESANWFAADFNHTAWDSMSVPGNWDLRNEYANYAGKAWYRKEFTADAVWKSKTVRLLFDGVNFESKVWVNGKLAGTNNIGYLPFEFDVSGLLNFGGSNTITVLCDNTTKLGAIWNWGGIRRTVKLVATNHVYITRQFVSPAVDLIKKTAEVNVKVLLRNNGTSAQNLSGEVLLSASNGFKTTMPFTANVGGGTTKEVTVKTVVNPKDVHLWSCDDPFLYQSQVSITNGTQTVHRISNRFGLRKIEIDNKNFSFKLNGESIRMMGFNLVPDDRTTGSTLPEWRIKEDVDLMKSFGANMARLSHLPLPDAMFDYLDEKGILVFSEIPLWGFHQLVDKSNPVPKEWLRRLVDNYYNHPSIIGWSVGNEIGDAPGVMEYVEDAIKYVKSIDTTRFGVMVSHTATRPTDPLQYSDLGLVNKYGTGIGQLADRMHARFPEKILFYSEYGYGQLNEHLDADVDAKGMIDSLRFKPYLIGGALWTFNDYRSNFYGTKEFSENRPWGIVDVFRQKKKAWYSFRREYAPIRDLRVEANQNGRTFSGSVTITPRKTFDLPAYKLQGYLLTWEAFNDSNKIIDGGYVQLPVILPGSKEIQQPIQLKDVSGLSHVKVELLDPNNYSVCDTTLYYKAPGPPTILNAIGIRTRQNDTATNSGAIRVIFDKKDEFTRYKVKYGVNELSQETPTTLGNHVDVPKLPFNATYRVAVVGVNAAGEGPVGDVKTVMVGTGYAPPLIYYSEPADGGFYVGYTTELDDYAFRIQYTTTKNDYSNASTIQTSTKGVLFVPDLVNGKSYFFRMSRIKDNSYVTGWSEEHSIIPDGQQMPAQPILQGIIRNNTEALVIFEPVKKAISYSIQYRLKNAPEWKTTRVNAAQIRHAKITGLQKKNVYEFRVAAVTSNGESKFTEAVLK